jgi:hypothetical protein
VVGWNVANRAGLLESDTFIQITEHDALGRMTTLYNWHRDTAGQPGNSDRVAVYVPAYDARGALQSETLHVRATKRPGAGGRPSFESDADVRRKVQAITSVTRNAKGQKTTLVLGNRTTTRYDYDPENFRQRHLYTRRGAGFAADCAGDPDAARPARPCGVQNLHYTYDPSGNVTHVQDDAQDTIWFANQQVEPSNDFTYDALYRLIEATGRENDAAIGAPSHAEGKWPAGRFPSGGATRTYTQRYRYDRVGNFLSVRHIAPGVPGRPDGGWTREYDYAFSDTANQPASNRLWQTWLGGDRSNAVTYRPDDHGNMLNLDKTAPGLDIRWDWRDMIRALDLVGGGDAFYNYSIDKQRTRKRLQRNGGTSSACCLSTTSSLRAAPPSQVRTVFALANRRCSVTSTATTSARSAASSTPRRRSSPTRSTTPTARAPSAYWNRPSKRPPSDTATRVWNATRRAVLTITARAIAPTGWHGGVAPTRPGW